MEKNHTNYNLRKSKTQCSTHTTKTNSKRGFMTVFASFAAYFPLVLRVYARCILYIKLNITFDRSEFHLKSIHIHGYDYDQQILFSGSIIKLLLSLAASSCVWSVDMYFGITSK